MSTRPFLTIVAVLLALGPAALQAQDPDSTEIARLRAQVDAITRELERLQLGRDVVPLADTAGLGLGPAASKVYRARGGVSVGGYGEFVYERFDDATESGTPASVPARFDALRAVVYLGYKFNDRLLFNSEIEFEHGTTGGTGSVSVEFAYLDYRLAPGFGFRAGLLLPPMGFINELHEPPTYLAVARPETERRIIPTTWRENGIGIFGEGGGFAYRAYAVNGFDATGFTAAGLRGGRQSGSQALAEDFGVVGRVDFVGLPGVVAGGSAYLGNAGQEAGYGARTFITEGHLAYAGRGLHLRALLAVATVDDVAAIDAERVAAGLASSPVAERLVGWYLEGGYDVLRAVRTGHQFIPYVRYERIDTQDRLATGFTPDLAQDGAVLTLGAAWKPVFGVALKADYQIRRNEALTGLDRVSVALSYLF